MKVRFTKYDGRPLALVVEAESDGDRIALAAFTEAAGGITVARPDTRTGGFSFGSVSFRGTLPQLEPWDPTEPRDPQIGPTALTFSPSPPEEKT